MFQSASWLSVTYFIVFMYPWNNVLSWTLLIAVSIFCSLGIFFYYNYRKRMTGLVVYMFDANQKLVKQYKKLVVDYNNLIDYTNKPDRSNPITTGAVSGAASWIMKNLLEAFMG